MTTESVQERYRQFADLEARGVSGTYERWARGIASDATLASRIALLPAGKRQANLLFAAARHGGAPVGTYDELRSWLDDNWEATERTILARSTQTNEAARCAVLLPALARIDGPVALVEVGASAGLCLYPDRYSYEYTAGRGTTRLDPAGGPSDVVLPCELRAGEAPQRLPDVVWRAGIDLNPLDITDPDDLAWLETLVWPEHDARRERLARAASIVAQDPPTLVRGDLSADLDALIARAPEGAHVVVLHSAVLVYVERPEREAFVRDMLGRDDITWVSNEGAGVLPDITAQVDRPVEGRTIVAVDGRATALVGPHGQSYEAL